ncbi:MAG: guanylate kinase, partial [Pseudothermotoga sp.]
KRLLKRGTERQEDMIKRLEDAKKELEQIPKFQYLIVNVDLQESIDQLTSIIVAEQLKVNRVIERLGFHKIFSGGGDSK